MKDLLEVEVMPLIVTKTIVQSLHNTVGLSIAGTVSVIL